MIKGIVLAVFFAGALLISNYVMNRGTDDKIMTMGEPTLPVVSFTVSGQEINLLSGYVDQMDVTAMRDTITPLESNGTLQAEIAENGNKISKISYKVYSLDGADTYAEGKVKEEDGKVTLELGTALDQSAQEAVLKLTLTLGSGEAQKKVNYFTRIEKPDEITAWKCLTFAKDFHAKALDQSDEDTLSMYLEPGEESDNTTYQTVNIHSDITHIQWGDLNPEIVGDVQWSLKESNSVYTSILAKYQVRCQDDKEETARYNVKEFFRIRSVGDTIYLLDYNRDLQEVFSSRSVMDQKGILLGIVPEDVPYETNKQDSILAFVQNRTLWMYNKKNEELTKVFSFAEEDTQDVRSLNDQHAVRIISMDDHGNIAFAVYGYMNRGVHEGYEGLVVYHFNSDKNVVEEKAFIPISESYEFLKRDLGKLSYVNEQNELFLLFAQNLYKVDIEGNSYEILEEGIKYDNFVASDNNDHAAWLVTEGDSKGCIREIDFDTKKIRTITYEKGQRLRTAGFINEDLVYGILQKSDILTDSNGHRSEGIQTLRIEDFDGNVKKEYHRDGLYITNISVGNTLIEFELSAKSGDTYTVQKKDTIMNNGKAAANNVKIELISASRTGVRVKLVLSETAQTENPLAFYAKISNTKEEFISLDKQIPQESTYYVYARGGLDSTWTDPAKAVQRADEQGGVVLNRAQQYVWERGNMKTQLTLNTTDIPEIIRTASLDVQNLQNGLGDSAKVVNLSGCSLENVLYEVSAQRAVIAKTGADSSVVIVGYDQYNTYLLDPSTGEVKPYGMNDSTALFESAGNVFLTYIENVTE